MFMEERLTVHRGEALVLQIIAAGVGGAAQQKSTLAVVRQAGYTSSSVLRLVTRDMCRKVVPCPGSAQSDLHAGSRKA